MPMVKRRLKGRSKGPASPTPRRRRALKRLETDADVQTSYFFMLNCLLHSRVQTGLESNTERYDEDVNVYLAHLLNSHIEPGYLLRTSPMIAVDDAHVFRMIEQSGSDRQRYEIYRANADYLLISVAVFDVFDERHYHHRSDFHTPKTVYIARAAAYYGLAASFATKLARGPSSIADTFSKLSEGIESYVRILMYMRGQYLNFIKRYSDGELFHLERSIEDIRRAELIEERRNEFLDVYHAWMRTRDEDLKERLSESAELLRQVDPTFEFQVP